MKHEEQKFLKLIKDDGESQLLATDQASKQDLALVELVARLTNGKERALKPGMLAQWKPGLKNRRGPDYGAPVVVVQFLDKPIDDASFQSGSPYFREPLDLLCGQCDPEGEFLVYHYDSRRFEPYRGQN